MENFDHFTNREIVDETDYANILKEDIEVEEAMEDVEPSPEMKNYQTIIYDLCHRQFTTVRASRQFVDVDVT